MNKENNPMSTLKFKSEKSLTIFAVTVTAVFFLCYSPWYIQQHSNTNNKQYMLKGQQQGWEGRMLSFTTFLRFISACKRIRIYKNNCV